MVDKLSGNKLGLALGLFFALIHLVWSLIVLSGVAQALLDWVYSLHFLTIPIVVGSFDIVKALLLIIMAFVGGFILGWIFAAIWNWSAKKVK
jgi:hypothetical protein